MPTAPSPLRPGLTWAALVCVLAVFVWQMSGLTSAGSLPEDDFAAFWSAGRLLLTGENPYNPARLMALEKSVGRIEDTINMFWYPPWSLPLFLPFSLLAHPYARAAWLVIHLAITLFSADALWRFYGGRDNLRWVALLLAVAFEPVLGSLKLGQTGPLLLLGFVGFLGFLRQGRDFLPGLCLTLPFIKPQASYLFWLAFLFWAVHQRRWRMLGGFIGGLALLAMIALCLRPTLLLEYYAAIASPPELPGATAFHQWMHPLLGTLLRRLFGWEKVGLQFVPAVLGSVWMVWHWQKRRFRWNWSLQTPLLLLLSLPTAIYSMSYDYVLILPAIIHGAILLLSRKAAAATSPCCTIMINMVSYLGASSLVLVQRYWLHLSDFWCLWLAPALLLQYLNVIRQEEK